MRRFKLINAGGAELDLMDKAAFFHDPDGLGANRSIDSVFTGSDWLEISSELKQPVIFGEMVFERYEKYEKFVEFCTYPPLTIGYSPAGQWFYRQCELQSVKKSEIERGSKRLVCPVEFLCFEPWYDTTTVSKAEDSTDSGKKYNYTYPYTYTESSAGSVRISNNRAMAAPCKIHIFGLVENPAWALYMSGALVSRGKVKATIPEGNKLVVDSTPNTMEISEYTAGNVYVQNLYQSSDFSTVRFIKIPPGNSIISFSHEGVGAIEAFVEVKRVAVTV